MFLYLNHLASEFSIIRTLLYPNYLPSGHFLIQDLFSLSVFSVTRRHPYPTFPLTEHFLIKIFTYPNVVLSKFSFIRTLPYPDFPLSERLFIQVSLYSNACLSKFPHIRTFSYPNFSLSERFLARTFFYQTDDRGSIPIFVDILHLAENVRTDLFFFYLNRKECFILGFIDMCKKISSNVRILIQFLSSLHLSSALSNLLHTLLHAIAMKT